MKNTIVFLFAIVFISSFSSALLPVGYTFTNRTTGIEMVVVNNYYANESIYSCNQVPTGEQVCSYPKVEYYDEATCGCSQYGPLGNCYGYFPKETHDWCYFEVEDTTQPISCVAETTEVCEWQNVQREILETRPVKTVLVNGNQTAIRVNIISADVVRTNSIPAKNESWVYFKNLYGGNNNFKKNTHFAYISDFLGETIDLETRTASLEGVAFWIVKHFDTLFTDVSALQTENANLKAKVNAQRNCAVNSGSYGNFRTCMNNVGAA